MIFCLTFSVLKFLANKWSTSILFIAVAALQNTAVMPFLLVPVLFGAQQVWKNRNWLWTDLGLLFLSGAVFIFPFLFNEYELGVLSPIAFVGSYGLKFFTWDRLWSLYFDLNQGAILILAPLVTIFFFWPRGLFRNPQFRWFLVWTVATLGSVVMVSGIFNWNSGGSVIMRYASWISVPIVLIAAFALTKISSKWASWVTLVASFLWALSFGFFGQSESSIQQNWLAKAVLNSTPDWYNPNPEIFCSRVQAREPCDPGRPSIYANQAGIKMKALVSSVTIAQICGDGKTLSFQSQSKHREYIYLNGPIDCRDPEI